MILETVIVTFSLISSLILLVGLIITVDSAVVDYSRAWQLLVVASISPFILVELMYLILLLS